MKFNLHATCLHIMSDSSKIVIVSGTNRANSLSRQIAEVYSKILDNLHTSNEIVDLSGLPPNFPHTALYENAGRDAKFNTYREIMVKAHKFIFIVPEYNGSFPGILKAFIDGLIFPDTFKNKKCALVGISSGTQGGGLALSHLTDIFNYCGTHVLALKPRLFHINKHLQDGILKNELYMGLLQEQAESLILF